MRDFFSPMFSFILFHFLHCRTESKRMPIRSSFSICDLGKDTETDFYSHYHHNVARRTKPTTLQRLEEKLEFLCDGAKKQISISISNSYLYLIMRCEPQPSLWKQFRELSSALHQGGYYGILKRLP